MTPCLDDETLARLVADAHDPDDRARAVAHLERCEECRALVVDAVQLADETRTIAGRYRLQGEIGRGAMGVVYRARDDVLDRLVAIKLLAADGARARARLVRESRAMARLRHPNVVAVHDAGYDGQQFWIAMEYVPGVTLRRWLERRTGASVAQTVAVIAKAARGLAAAHAVGVVHRDFKPDNVLLDRDGEPKVADFGLAQWGQPLDEDTEADRIPTIADALTVKGTLVGTPAYMAPEQARGETIDARADVFAVCAVLWEALHGVRPFVESSIDVRLAAIERGVFVIGRRRLPPALRRTLARGLAFDPGQRQPDMPALVAELDAFGTHGTRRRRAALALAGAALLTVGAGAIATADRQPCPPPEDRLAHAAAPAQLGRIRDAVMASPSPMASELAWSQLRPEIEGTVAALDQEAVLACEARRERSIDDATATRRDECSRLERSALAYRLELAAGGDVEAAQGLPYRSSATWCRELADTWADHDLDPTRAAERSAVEQALAEVSALAELARVDPMRARADEALRLAEALGDPVLVARARFERGHATFEPTEAIAILEQAATEAAAVGEHSTAAMAWIYAGYYGSREQSARHLSAARREVDEVGNANVVAWLEGLAAHVQGLVLLADGRPTAARAEFERAIAMAHELAPGKVPEFWWYITLAHWAAGDLDAALATQRDLVAWHERARGPSRFVHARALWNLADLEREHGEHGRALQTIRRAHEIAAASDDATAHAHHLVAEAQIRIARGELAEAAAAIERAAASRATPGTLAAARGLLALARGEYREAVKWLRASLPLVGSHVDLGLDPADVTAALAEALWRDGRPREGSAIAEPELARLRALHPALPERGRVAAVTGRILLDLGRPREALERFEEALAVLTDPQQQADADAGRRTALALLERK